jgi:hypothetical protein
VKQRNGLVGLFEERIAESLAEEGGVPERRRIGASKGIRFGPM